MIKRAEHREGLHSMEIIHYAERERERERERESIRSIDSLKVMRYIYSIYVQQQQQRLNIDTTHIYKLRSIYGLHHIEST